MPGRNDSSGNHRSSFWVVFCIGLVWTILIAGFLVHLQVTNNKSAEKQVINTARAYFNKDYSLRLWAASHGGVYVPVSKTTPPNPLLSHVKDRDVVTPSGMTLTLMNPDYFLRNYREDFKAKYGVSGDLTSLKPLQPKNTPDEWQKCSLEKFEEGVTEELSFVDINGETHIRLMQPLMTEEGCLKCHGHQGFKVGDVRGGVSVSVPTSIYTKEADKANLQALYILSSIWGIGIAGLVISNRAIQKNVVAKLQAYDNLVASNRALDNKIKVINSLNKDLEAFDYTLSNALKVPIRHIEGFSQLMLDRVEGDDSSVRNYAEIISHSSEDLRALVDSILILSRANRQEVIREENNLSLIATQLLQRIKAEREAVNLSWKVQEELNCPCDGSLVRILLHNLLDNAVKFSLESDNEQYVEFGLCTQGGEKSYFVRDHGTGFDMSRFDKLFVPFHSYHEDSEFQGLGLGLATAKRVVERHGGRLWAESSPGTGSIFYFTLGYDEDVGSDSEQQVQ